MSEWTKCSERMPDLWHSDEEQWHSKPCLVLSPLYAYDCIENYRVATYYEDGTWWDKDGNELNDVTHWIERPEPPKEEV